MTQKAEFLALAEQCERRAGQGDHYPTVINALLRDCAAALRSQAASVVVDREAIAAHLKRLGFTSRDGTYLQGGTIGVIDAIASLIAAQPRLHLWTYNDCDGDPRLDGKLCTVYMFSLSAPKDEHDGIEIDKRSWEKLKSAAPAASATFAEPCEYCGPGKSTGLPGNACENCMNTGLKYPELAAASATNSANFTADDPTGTIKLMWDQVAKMPHADTATNSAPTRHDYSPSALHMGDCDICGNVRDAEVHALHADTAQPTTPPPTPLREPDEITEDAIRRRAKVLVTQHGWKPGNTLGLTSVIGLMTALGMELSRTPETDRCGYPECGCDFDATCNAALAASEGVAK